MKLKNKQKAYYSLIFGLIAFLLVTPNINKDNNLNTPESADVYITQIEIDDLSVNNWTWAKIMGYCFGSGTELDPYVIGNDTFSYTSGDGLVIKNSRKYFSVINCTFKDSTSAGLLLNNVTNGLLINNTAYNNTYGIHIYRSWDINVTESVFDSNNQYNLYVDQSDNNTILLNVVIGKSDYDYGIYFSDSHDNLITRNNVTNVDRSQIMLVDSHNNDIIENICSYGISTGNGVTVAQSHNNLISKNVMIDCLRGVSLSNSDYNVVTDNLIEETDQGGIETTNSDHNTFINNVLSNTGLFGIGASSNFNQILNNNITDGIWRGISIVDSDDNLVLNNYLDNNTIGIRVNFGADRNNFSENVIKNSNEKGFLIYDNSHFNYVFNNTFDGNGLPAEDNSTNNFWDNGAIGNNWDTYVGTDLDDNGIGDTPQGISGTAGSQDNYPIYSDGDDIDPQITINSPSGGTVFGEVAPTFNLDVYDLNLDSFWYTIDGSTTKIFVTVSNGVNLVSIGGSIWDAVADGNHVFRFYANDTAGNEFNVEITINKDTSVDVPEPAIPGFNNSVLITTLVVFIGLMVIKIKKKKII